VVGEDRWLVRGAQAPSCGRLTKWSGRHRHTRWYFAGTAESPSSGPSGVGGQFAGGQGRRFTSPRWSFCRPPSPDERQKSGVGVHLSLPTPGRPCRANGRAPSPILGLALGRFFRAERGGLHEVVGLAAVVAPIAIAKKAARQSWERRRLEDPRRTSGSVTARSGLTTSWLTRASGSAPSGASTQPGFRLRSISDRRDPRIRRRFEIGFRICWCSTCVESAQSPLLKKTPVWVDSPTAEIIDAGRASVYLYGDCRQEDAAAGCSGGNRSRISGAVAP
jgi:hypothetical protein